MGTSKAFDPYDVIALITPGAVLTLYLMAIPSPLREILGESGVSLGEFGVFLIVAYVIGYLVQALGNFLEPVVWCGRTLPTDWVSRSSQSLLSSAQLATLTKSVGAMEGTERALDDYPIEEWRAVTRRAYLRIKAAGNSDKADTHNRGYGMCRGLTASFLVVALGFVANSAWPEAAGSTLLMLAAGYRMRRMGRRYAEALWLAFIDIRA